MLTLVLVGFAASCGGDDAASSAHTARDSLGVRIVESARPEFDAQSGWYLDSVPLLDLTHPAIGPSHEFYRVSDLTLLPDGSIATAEMGSGLVRRFSMSGELLHESGGEGDGPGEYRQLSVVNQYRADSIVAFDRWLGRATVLDGNLRVGRTIQFPAPYAGELAVLDDWTFVVQFIFPSVMEYEGEGGINRTPVPLVRYSAEGLPVDTLVVLPGDEELMIPSRRGAGWASMGLLFPKRSFFAALGRRVFVATSDQMSFDVLAADGSLLQRSLVPTWDLAVTREMIEREKYAFVPEDATPGQLRAVEERFALQPIPQDRPAFEALLADRQGGAWLAATTGRSNYYGPTRWEVFAATGEWLGSLTTPPRFLVHEVGPDYVLGVRLDEFDVEHPQVLRVIRSGGD
jgi:hypothetical protein